MEELEQMDLMEHLTRSELIEKFSTVANYTVLIGKQFWLTAHFRNR